MKTTIITITILAIAITALVISFKKQEKEYWETFAQRVDEHEIRIGQYENNY